MPDSQVIQEFLVSLGFKLDDSQRQRFDAALGANRQRADELDKTLASVGKQLGILGDQLLKIADRPTREAENAADRIAKRHAALRKGVKELGLTAVSTTAAFTTGFVEIAKQYEHLYYVSQRTGVSAQQLAALRYAGPQVGLNAGDLQAATEALATAARNPGIKNLINSWGVAETDLQGIIKHLAALPPYLQDAYAGMLGISTTTMRNLINNQGVFAKAQVDFNKRIAAAGVDYKKFTDDAVQVTRDLETVWSQLGIIGIQGFEEAYPSIHKVVGQVELLLDATLKWNASHPGAAMAENIAAALVSATGLLAVLGKVSGLPLLRYGVTAALLYGAEEGGRRLLTPPKKNDPHPFGEGWDPGTGNAVWDPINVIRRLIFGWGDTNPDGGKGQPHYAGGGIVPKSGPAYLHAEEMVLPANLSHGLQTLIAGLSGGRASTFADVFRAWLGGSTAYHPVVQVLGLNVDALNRSVEFAPADAGGRMVGRPYGRGAAASGAQGRSAAEREVYPSAAVAGAATRGDPRGMTPVLVAAAIANGINPDDVLAIARREGLGAKWRTYDVNGWSFGALQMHQRGTDPEGYKQPGGGMANAYWRATGKDPSNPANEADMDTWAIHWAAIHGWRPWTSVTSGRAIVPRKLAPGEATPVARSPFPPWVKFNSRGEPYELNMTAEERAKQAQSYAFIKAHPTSWMSRTLGGASDVHYDAGDKHITLNQTNNFHGGNGARGGHDHHHVLASLNRHAGRFLRNAKAAIN